MKKLALSLTLFAALFTVSCAMVPYAREVRKKPNAGGTIALKTYHNAQDRAQADLLMRSNCGTNEVKVTEEGEAVVGQVTSSNANTNYYGGRRNTANANWGTVTFGNYNPGESTNTTAETTQLKEWQIQYECVASHTSTKEKVAKKTKVKN